MPDTNISSASRGSAYENVSDVTISPQTTDGATGDETTWQNDKWSQWFGYYKTIPEVKIAIDMRATWTLGKGYIADTRTTAILDSIKGWGRDSFNSILKNMIIVRRIGGDSFAEIVRDEKHNLLNLKPLDPGTIKIVVDKKGILKRYEQVTKTGETKKFKPNEMFHLVNKRVADTIHGTSDIEAIEQIILANNEAFTINKQIVKNFSRPKMMVEIDSDDTAKINAFIAKFDDATSKGDNLFYPKGTVTPSVLAVPSNATLNVIPWKEHLNNYFYRVVGIPSILVGGGGETFTESAAKICYLAFEQSVNEEQLDLEEQIWNQLYLKINLEFPASMQNELISDTKKDGGMQPGFQPNDIMAGVGE